MFISLFQNDSLMISIFLYFFKKRKCNRFHEAFHEFGNQHSIQSMRLMIDEFINVPIKNSFSQNLQLKSKQTFKTFEFQVPETQETKLFSFLNPLSIDIWIYVVFAYLAVSCKSWNRISIKIFKFP